MVLTLLALAGTGPGPVPGGERHHRGHHHRCVGRAAARRHRHRPQHGHRRRARRRHRRQRALSRAAAPARHLYRSRPNSPDSRNTSRRDSHHRRVGRRHQHDDGRRRRSPRSSRSQADAAVVDLGKIDVGRNLNEREIHNLPLVSRNPYNFALLQPGVSGLENAEFGVPRFSANGSLPAHQLPDGRQHQHAEGSRRPAPDADVGSRHRRSEGRRRAATRRSSARRWAWSTTRSRRRARTSCAATSSYRFRRTPFSAYPFYSTITPRTAENKPKDVVNTVTASAGGPIVQDRAHYYAGFERTYRDMTNTFTFTPGTRGAGRAAGAAEHGAGVSERAVLPRQDRLPARAGRTA